VTKTKKDVNSLMSSMVLESLKSICGCGEFVNILNKVRKKVDGVFEAASAVVSVASKIIDDKEDDKDAKKRKISTPAAGRHRASWPKSERFIRI
jgi:sugar-specific transcriptional regulator TrmB